MTAFTRDHVEAAMCMWEHVLANLDNADSPWNGANDGIGMVALRMIVLDAAVQCDTDYSALPEEERADQCFDWDYVPDWMDRHADELLNNKRS